MDFTKFLSPSDPQCADSLAHERKASKDVVEPLSLHLLGADYLERQELIVDILKAHSVFDKSKSPHLAHDARYRLALQRGAKLIHLARSHGWTDEDWDMALYLLDEMSPLALQKTMFKQTIVEQADERQRRYWLPKIDNWSIIGAYAQTEMGHGSNVQRLELTARYDTKTKQFILHSPTLTASKWWNGALGRTASHAIVVAQLFCPKSPSEPDLVSHGPHAFVVRIRAKRTHTPLPGIVVGDIGPKYGYASMDNGYMLFNQFAIPHDALLARNCRVDKITGQYSRIRSRKALYGSLTHMRTYIVRHSSLVLARSTTIAVRYAAVRRQFSSGDLGAETPILDYVTVQIRILPLAATVYALHYTGKAMERLVIATQTVEDGDRESAIAELHALTSGLKAYCTELVTAGIETCRRACGGHGYAAYSGFLDLAKDYLSKATVEGDNWMIPQQLSRYLVKIATAVSSGKRYGRHSSSGAQLETFHLQQSREMEPIGMCEDDEAVALALERLASKIAFDIAAEVPEIAESRPTRMLHLARVKSAALLVRNFHQQVFDQDIDLPHQTLAILRDLYRLFAYRTADDFLSDLMIHNIVRSSDPEKVQSIVIQHMQSVRPYAVALVDAWKMPDYLLDSALGRNDGRVYENIFERVHHGNPLNDVPVNPFQEIAKVQAKI